MRKEDIEKLVAIGVDRNILVFDIDEKAGVISKNVMCLSAHIMYQNCLGLHAVLPTTYIVCDNDIDMVDHNWLSWGNINLVSCPREYIMSTYHEFAGTFPKDKADIFIAYNDQTGEVILGGY